MVLPRLARRLLTEVAHSLHHKADVVVALRAPANLGKHGERVNNTVFDAIQRVEGTVESQI